MKILYGWIIKMGFTQIIDDKTEYSHHKKTFVVGLDI